MVGSPAFADGARARRANAPLVEGRAPRRAGCAYPSSAAAVVRPLWHPPAILQVDNRRAARQPQNGFARPRYAPRHWEPQNVWSRRPRHRAAYPSASSRGVPHTPHNLGPGRDPSHDDPHTAHVAGFRNGSSRSASMHAIEHAAPVPPAATANFASSGPTGDPHFAHRSEEGEARALRSAPHIGQSASRTRLSRYARSAIDRGRAAGSRKGSDIAVRPPAAGKLHEPRARRPADGAVGLPAGHGPPRGSDGADADPAAPGPAGLPNAEAGERPAVRDGVLAGRGRRAEIGRGAG